MRRYPERGRGPVRGTCHSGCARPRSSLKEALTLDRGGYLGLPRPLRPFEARKSFEGLDWISVHYGLLACKGAHSAFNPRNALSLRDLEHECSFVAELADLLACLGAGQIGSERQIHWFNDSRTDGCYSRITSIECVRLGRPMQTSYAFADFEGRGVLPYPSLWAVGHWGALRYPSFQSL